MVKLGQALALVLSGLVLKLIGFDGGAASQSAETMYYLRIADITIPSLTAAIAMIIMWKYNLDEEKSRKLKEDLVARRGEL
jgi:GPH family glycoside/pentoside/hexuronide:cation symporter